MERETSIYEEQLSKLLSDTEFEKMELMLKLPNIFTALSISRKEIKHSNFLSWILDPNESHGIGELLLRKFLREIFKNNKNISHSFFDVDLFDLKFVEIRREWKNIDLLIIHSEFVIVLENKIDSEDHSNQLNRYKEIIDTTFQDKDRVYVYMTPFGTDPNDEMASNIYINYSYFSLCVSIEEIIEIYKESLNLKVITYLKDYTTVLRREIMENDELNIIAGKIYNAHKAAIDFIIENKPDIYTELYPFFEFKVKESNWIIGSKTKGYIRFLTKDLNDIIPRGKSDTY